MLAAVQIYALPAAAQTGGTDTQATQEEEALDDLLTDEDEIKFKREPPPAGSRGGNQWEDPASGQEAPATPVDPEQVITSPTNIDPARDPLSKAEKHAAQIYVDDEISKRLERVAGRVPEDEIEHHVVYTPSAAAQQDPNRKALERQLWNQRLADYKQAKLAERLLNDLDSAGANPAAETASRSAADGGATAERGGAAAGGENSDGDIASLFERLLGTGGSGGSKPGTPAQTDTGTGDGKSARGTAGTAASRDPSARDANASDQAAGSAPRGSAAQPLGTVTLGEPPAAPRGQSSAFDNFVAESGILGQQNGTSGSAARADSAATAPSAQDGPSVTEPGAGQFSAVPKAKPVPPGPFRATADVSASAEAPVGSRGGEAANTTKSRPSAGTSGSPTGGQGARAAQRSELSSQSTVGASGQDGSAAPNPLAELLAAATAALDRADPTDKQPPDPLRSPETSDRFAVPAGAASPPVTEAAPQSAEAKEESSAIDPPVVPTEQTRSPGESFADRFSFSQDIAALSPDAKDRVPNAPKTPPRQQFERAAMEKFIANQPLSPAEQAFIEEARQASAAKSEDQINDQVRKAGELQTTATAVHKDVAAVIDASEDSDRLAYLQPVATANDAQSRTLHAGGQAIEVMANRPSGRAAPELANRESKIAERDREPDGSIKLMRPDRLKSATDDAAKSTRSDHQPAPKRERQIKQSERLAAKLEREARHEATKVRFDNCVLFIFCSLTKLVLPKSSPGELEQNAPLGSGEGVQRVRP